MYPLPIFSLLSSVSPPSPFSPLDYFDILLLGVILMVDNLLFFALEKCGSNCDVCFFAGLFSLFPPLRGCTAWHRVSEHEIWGQGMWVGI